MDRALFDFRGLRPTGAPDPAGDTAFDEEGCGDESSNAIQFKHDDD